MPPLPSMRLAMKRPWFLGMATLLFFMLNLNAQFEEGERETLTRFLKEMSQKVTAEDLFLFSLEHTLESTLTREQNIMLKTLPVPAQREIVIHVDLIQQPDAALFKDIELTVEYYHFSKLNEKEMEEFKSLLKSTTSMDTFRKMMFDALDRSLKKTDHHHEFNKKEFAFLKNFIGNLLSSSSMTMEQVCFVPLDQGIGVEKSFSLSSVQESYGEMTHYGKFK